HFDHIIPYSKGGSSLVADNIQLLCTKHNLEKRDKIQ
ncbi:MAG: HNH endonuclease, partial [Thermoplasmatales archaeon]|nr:HNH endonuclease [Thermoplasmatales archaeon]